MKSEEDYVKLHVLLLFFYTIGKCPYDIKKPSHANFVGYGIALRR